MGLHIDRYYEGDPNCPEGEAHLAVTSDFTLQGAQNPEQEVIERETLTRREVVEHVIFSRLDSNTPRLRKAAELMLGGVVSNGELAKEMETSSHNAGDAKGQVKVIIERSLKMRGLGIE